MRSLRFGPGGRDGGLEAFEANLRLRHLHRGQQTPHAVDHRLRSADERDRVANVRHRRSNQRLVDPTWIDAGARRTFGGCEHHPDLRMAAGQRGDLVAKREMFLTTCGIEQRDRPRRLGFRRMAQHAKQRSDADAAGQKEQRPIVLAG